MLCTSFDLHPLTSTASVSRVTSPSHNAPPVEHLHDVYLCASCPAVVEAWVGWPHTLNVAARNGGDAQAVSATPDVPVPLSTLVETYNRTTSSSTQVGASFVQVLAIGVHRSLSVEAKAVVAGAAMSALRTHLAQLLRKFNNSSRKTSDELELREVVKKCCRFARSVSAPPQSVTAGETDAGVAEEKDERGAWTVTWAPELLTAVASALADRCGHDAAVSFAVPMTIGSCKGVLQASVEGGLRARLQRDGCFDVASDLASYMLEDTASQSITGTSSIGLCTCDSLLVRMTKCTPVRTHPLDVQRAIDIGCKLYRMHVRPAQEHTEDGTEALREFLQLTSQSQQPYKTESTSGDVHCQRHLAQASALWRRALDAYHSSAVAAQEGVLYFLKHDVRVQGSGGGSSSLMPLTVEEEYARVQVAVAQQSLNLMQAGLKEEVLTPLRLHNNSSGGTYVNNVVLTQQWDTTVVGASSSSSVAIALMRLLLLDRQVNGGEDEGSDNGEAVAVLAPARAALRWRMHFKPMPKDGSLSSMINETDTVLPGAVLQPTPLQWVLYTLRRQLIVAVANTAQVLLTGHRLHLPSSPSNSSSLHPPSAPLSVSATRAQAERCVKAQGLLRGLIKWHCPYPVPLSSSVNSAGAIALSSTSLNELLWCLRLLGKLYHRAAALYGCVGDVASRQGQLRQWQDQLQRWESRRAAQRKRRSAVDEETDGKRTAAMSSSVSVEDVVGHIDDATWSVFLREVSAGLPGVRLGN